MTEAKKQAKVAKVVDQFKVVLNIGAAQGVTTGDDYIIYRIGEDIIDPDTGDSLGEYEEVIGRGTVTHVQDKMCTLESSEIKSSGRKVIRKYTGGRSGMFTVIAGLGSPSEEIIEEPEKIAQPFSHALVGDMARRLF